MDDHYLVLGFPHRRHDQTLSVQDIRKAYRQALLKYHPDKIESDKDRSQHNGANIQRATPYTIDQITVAFNTLSDADSKAAYDQSLRQRNGNTDAARFFSGLDTVDLDDLNYDEAHETWHRSCRCGHDKGFLVTEDDLEDAAADGELVTGCRGCSLWLKVLFQSAVDGDPDLEAEQESAPSKPTTIRL